MKFFFYTFLFIIFMSCSRTQNQAKKDLKEIAKEIMKNAKYCALITIDSLGVAHVRAMDPFLPEEDFTVWMATNPKSLKVQQTQKNNKVSLYYFDKATGSYVTLQGTAKIVNTQNEKEKYWKKEWEKFYKNKTTEYVLIRFTPIKASIINEKEQILGDSVTWKTPTLDFKNE